MDDDKSSSVDIERIANIILWLRGQKVILDADLAALYEVPTKVLVQAVKRNIERFPEDFMFQLSGEESRNLRSQIVTSSWGGRRYTPYAFTEQGVAMLSSVLKSPRAIAVNIEIMRAFVRLRVLLGSNRVLKRKLDELERRVGAHDGAIAGILAAIRELMKPPEPPRRSRMGFVAEIEKD
jgi:hypothetical protein